MAITFIRWKPLITTTIVMYILVLLFWAIYQPIATILLISILCLWSRVPAMVSWFTKDTDVIDFFTVFIALNVGGLWGGVFAWTVFMFSRFFGPVEDFEYTIKDANAFFIGGLLTPFFFTITGGNLLLTIYFFTIFGRYAVYLFQDLVFTPAKIILDAGLILVGIPIAYFSNTFLVTAFGDTLNDIFRTGMKVNIGLFLTVTGLVLFFFIITRFIEKGEQKIQSKVKYEKALKPHFIQEPHEVFFSYFNLDHLPALITGSFRYFKLKLFLVTFSLMAAAFIYYEYVPKWYEVIFLVFILFIAINILVYLSYLLLGKDEAKQNMK
ncbi:hypothetical protein GOV09_06920 [Candidatus Woesearchaeota archaeon]|nr:hypothetical protein [Candidatus Woesearchaeota archaeon]